MPTSAGPISVLPVPAPTVGVIIVDHGSRREESNHMLEEIVARFAAEAVYPIVEPAHMELAHPTIADAFDRCVARGARLIVVMPYFLLPGKHWDEDIPRLAAQAAAKHKAVRDTGAPGTQLPGVRYLVTAPLGLHPMMRQVIAARIDHCLQHAGGTAPECSVCSGSGRCALHTADEQPA